MLLARESWSGDGAAERDGFLTARDDTVQASAMEKILPPRVMTASYALTG